MAKTKTPKKPSRRSSRISKAKVAAAQNNLQDGDGAFASTAHDRYPEVDRIAKKMFNARDAAAVEEDKRKDALESLQIKLAEKGHQGVYYYDHAGGKYKLEITSTEKLSVAKCSKDELA